MYAVGRFDLHISSEDHAVEQVKNEGARGATCYCTRICELVLKELDRPKKVFGRNPDADAVFNKKRRF